MNGFLSPSGFMHTCDYEKHYELAKSLVTQNHANGKIKFDDWVVNNDDRTLKKIGFLYFGCTPDLGTNTDSYVFMDNDKMVITEAQIKWAADNKQKITSKQYKLFLDLVEEMEKIYGN